MKINKISENVIRIDDGIRPVETHAFYTARIEKGILIISPLMGDGKTYADKFENVIVNGAHYPSEETLLEALSFIGNFSGGGGTSVTTLPAFAPATFYVRDQAIVEAGVIYIALADFTSGATFDPADWQEIGSSPTDITSASLNVGGSGYSRTVNLKAQNANDNAVRVDETTGKIDLKLRNFFAKIDAQGRLDLGDELSETIDGKFDIPQGLSDGNYFFRMDYGTFTGWQRYEGDLTTFTGTKAEYDVWQPAFGHAGKWAAHITDIKELRIGVGQVETGTIANYTDLSNYYDKTEIDDFINDEETARATADNALDSRIDSLLGILHYLKAYDFGTDVEADLQTLLTVYAQTQLGVTDIPNSVAVQNLFNNHEWIYNESNGEWIDNGVATVVEAENGKFGIVQGSTERLKIGIDPVTKEMEVNGLEDPATKLPIQATLWDNNPGGGADLYSSLTEWFQNYAGDKGGLWEFPQSWPDLPVTGQPYIIWITHSHNTPGNKIYTLLAFNRSGNMRTDRGTYIESTGSLTWACIVSERTQYLPAMDYASLMAANLPLQRLVGLKTASSFFWTYRFGTDSFMYFGANLNTPQNSGKPAIETGLIGPANALKMLYPTFEQVEAILNSNIFPDYSGYTTVADYSASIVDGYLLWTADADCYIDAVFDATGSTGSIYLNVKEPNKSAKELFVGGGAQNGLRIVYPLKVLKGTELRTGADNSYRVSRVMLIKYPLAIQTSDMTLRLSQKYF